MYKRQGNLLAEPKDAAEKKAGGLGMTAKKELIKIYNLVVYDWDEDVYTPAMEKGTLVQPESIAMYSKVEGKLFTENAEQLENEFFKGMPDVFDGKTVKTSKQVDDMKNSWSLKTFSPKFIEPVTLSHRAQLNVYYDLSGAEGGNIVHTLISMPESMFKSECDRLLWKMANKGEIATEYAPEYIEAVEQLKKQHLFDHIDERERVFKQPVPKDEELIQKMKDKVPILRQWLADYHKLRQNHYPKS